MFRILSVIATLFAFVLHAHGQTFVWDGGGADNNWGTSANWSTTSPTSGINTRVDFLGSVRPTPVLNSYGYSPDPFQLNQLTLNTITSFSLSGNDLDFRTNGSAATPLITVLLPATHSIANNLILSNHLTISSVASGNLGLTGSMSGSGNLTISMGAGSVLTLSNTHSYAGTTSINTGTVTLNGSLSTSSSVVTISGGSVVNGTGTINRPVTIGGVTNFGGSLTITDVLNVNSTMNIQANQSLAVNGLTSVSDGASLQIQNNASLGGSGNVTVAGSGQIAFFGNSVIGTGKTVTLNGSVSSRAAVSGAGTVEGPIVMNGAVVRSGFGTTIVLNGPVTMNSATVSNQFGISDNDTVQANGPITVSSGTNHELIATNLTGTGNILVNAGTVLRINSTVANTKTLTLNGETHVFSTGTYNGPVNVNNGVIAGNTFTINGALSLSGATSIGKTGGPTQVITTNGNITINSGASISIAAATTWNGTGSLTINNGGLFNLTSTGPTTRNGTDVFGSLTGTGTLNSVVKSFSGSTIAPGNSTGTITISGGLDLGGTLEMEIHSGGQNNSTTSGTTTPGTGFDTIIVSPPPSSPSTPTNAIVRQGTQIRLLALNSNLGTSFWNSPSGQRWLLIQTTNGAIQFSSGEAGDPIFLLPGIPTPNVQLIDSTTGNPINFLATYPNSSFSYERTFGDSSQNLNLVWTPVPEPHLTIAFAGMLVAGLAIRQKRRNADKLPVTQ